MKLKKAIIFSVLPFFLIIISLLFVIIGVAADEESSGNSNSKGVLTNVDLSPDVLAYKSLVEKYCKEFGIEDYVCYLLAIMEVESGGVGEDVMQCSESMGLPPNSIESPEKSIKQGCKVFAEHLQNAEALGVDLDSVIQSYNYGGSFLNYVAGKGQKYSYDLACEFSKEKSNGKTVNYVNNISYHYGSWKYTYGNQFYVLLVRQYISLGSSDLAEFALQFVGENHSRFTTYESKNSNAFGADWCAMFVSYCLDNLGYMDSGDIWWFTGCTTMYNQLLAADKWEYSAYYNGTYIPKAGDLIFFSSNGSVVYHVGMVTSCDSETITTVEGNTGDSAYSGDYYWMGSSVNEYSYSIGYYKIIGYCSIG